MVSGNNCVSYFILLFALTSRAEQEVRQSKAEASNALFSQTGYPHFGDIPVLNRKIFRGMRVSILEHPYVVSIRRQSAHYVVGAILAKNVVVTVAHPLYNVSTLELSIVAGENYCDRGSTMLTVLTVVTHEDFDPYTLAADIALIRFYEDLVLKVSQKTIPLFVSKSEQGKINYDKCAAYVTGWGRCDLSGKELCWPRSSIYYPDEKLDPMLRTITFKYVNPEQNVFCKAYEDHDVPLRPGMLCAGAARYEEPLAPCLAVPGAPLVISGRLVGVQSWGLGCGFTQDLPLIYTDVGHYSQWLKENLKIMSNVSYEMVFDLYQATRASLVREWLVRTRVEVNERAPLPAGAAALAAAPLDCAYAALRGHVTDFRDYIHDAMYRSAKQEMFQKLRERAALLKSLKDIHDNITTPTSYPFYATNVEDAGYIINTTSSTDMAADLLLYSDLTL